MGRETELKSLISMCSRYLVLRPMSRIQGRILCIPPMMLSTIWSGVIETLAVLTVLWGFNAVISREKDLLDWPVPHHEIGVLPEIVEVVLVAPELLGEVLGDVVDVNRERNSL